MPRFIRVDSTHKHIINLDTLDYAQLKGADSLDLRFSGGENVSLSGTDIATNVFNAIHETLNPQVVPPPSKKSR